VNDIIKSSFELLEVQPGLYGKCPKYGKRLWVVTNGFFYLYSNEHIPTDNK
jgi:hypothetical protein